MKITVDIDFEGLNKHLEVDIADTFVLYESYNIKILSDVISSTVKKSLNNSLEEIISENIQTRESFAERRGSTYSKSPYRDDFGL